MPEQAYVDALVADLEAALPLIWGRTVHTVFLGGGTPSLFSPEAIDRLLAAVRSRVRLEAAAEITLEANPEDVTADLADAWLAAGVTRISLGMQSADPRALAVLDRRHTPGGAQRAAAVLRERGFAHVSLDLIYGVPGQSETSWSETVTAALET